MSTVEYNFEMNVEFPEPNPKSNSPSEEKRQTFHRIAEVRSQQGASLRSLSRKLNLTASELREQEDPQADLHISDLLKWQEVLEVPLVDLLVDSNGPLSEPVEKRANMLRVMKTAKAIQETVHDNPSKRLANMLVTQLTEIMPELAEVSAWHSVGQRRTRDELGRIVERSIPDNFFNDPNSSQ